MCDEAGGCRENGEFSQSMSDKRATVLFHEQLCSGYCAACGVNPKMECMMPENLRLFLRARGNARDGVREEPSGLYGLAGAYGFAADNS